MFVCPVFYLLNLAIIVSEQKGFSVTFILGIKKKMKIAKMNTEPEPKSPWIPQYTDQNSPLS